MSVTGNICSRLRKKTITIDQFHNWPKFCLQLSHFIDTVCCIICTMAVLTNFVIFWNSHMIRKNSSNHGSECNIKDKRTSFVWRVFSTCLQMWNNSKIRQNYYCALLHHLSRSLVKWMQWMEKKRSILENGF